MFAQASQTTQQLKLRTLLCTEAELKKRKSEQPPAPNLTV
jgi:hypothetical protein